MIQEIVYTGPDALGGALARAKSDGVDDRRANPVVYALKSSRLEAWAVALGLIGERDLPDGVKADLIDAWSEGWEEMDDEMNQGSAA